MCDLEQLKGTSWSVKNRLQTLRQTRWGSNLQVNKHSDLMGWDETELKLFEKEISIRPRSRFKPVDTCVLSYLVQVRSPVPVLKTVP